MDAYDHSPDEVESRAELDHHLAGGSLARLTVQGMSLTDDPPDFGGIDVTDTLFVACRFASPEVEADLVRRGAHVVPDFHEVLYPTHPSRLYTPEDLAAGHEHGFEGMYDTQVYRHFVASGGASPPIREALAQRMHDHGIDDALTDTMHAWTAASGGPVVGVMGGHAARRDSAHYRTVAEIGARLAAAGSLVVTGGGPGVMEAANLGAAMSTLGVDALYAGIDQLSTAPDFADHDPYTKVALDLRAALPQPAAPTTREPGVGGSVRRTVETAGGDTGTPAAGTGTVDWARHGGLSVPTWLYGHEPANLFSARIAKYFSNAIREDTILRLARGGIVFAPGRAGTVQEVFQAATKAYYATDGASGPFVFLGTKYWTDTLPVRSLLTPLLASSSHGDLSKLVNLTDDVAEAVESVLAYGAADEGTTP